MSLNAGDLDKRVVIDRDTPTRDGHGNDVASWAAIATVWAKVIYGDGREQRAAAQDRAGLTATFRIRKTAATAAIRPDGYRLIFDGFNWDIVNRAPLGDDGLELTATTAFEAIARALSGAVAGSSSLTGLLSVHAPLAGVVAAQGALSGTISVHAPLTGNVAGQGGLGGALSVLAPLAGTVAGISTLEGTIGVHAPLAGDVAGTSSLTGSLVLDHGLEGNVAGHSTLEGTIGVHAPLAGDVAGTSALTGTLTNAEPFGPELIVNGDMSSGTGWTLLDQGELATVTISGGKLNIDDSVNEAGNTGAEQAVTLDNGATYRLVFTIDSITGSGSETVYPAVGGTPGTPRSTPGTFSEDLVAGVSDAMELLTEAGTVCVIDNVSLREVL